MAHEIEQLANGQSAFATARIPAWHQLGTVTDATMTGKQAMAAAHLGDWNIRLDHIQAIDTAADGTVTRIDCPDKRATVRTRPDTGAAEVLGIVSADYRIIQNEECAGLLDKLVDESDAHFETAGSLKGGRQVFITMKLPSTMYIADSDAMDLYLAFTTSHDGTAAARVDATPVRVVCANTQRAALRQSVAHYEFRHTESATAKIAEARQALGLTWKYFEAFQADADKMINEQLSMDEFTRVISQLWPIGEDASAQAKNNAKQRDASLRWLFRDADTQASIRGTRWAGYQSVVEFIDHYAPASTPEIRARRAVAGSGADIKSRAFELMSVG